MFYTRLIKCRCWCLIIFFGLFTLKLNAQNLFKNGTIYIVRHAEKVSGKDPVLTREGELRSGDLLRKLKKHPPELIYVSQFKRTALTADSLRLQLNIDTFHYTAEQTADSLMKVLRLKNNCILIIAHSNTIPSIIKKFVATEDIIIPDEQFDDLFIIRFKKGKLLLTRDKYGKISILKTADQIMQLQ